MSSTLIQRLSVRTRALHLPAWKVLDSIRSVWSRFGHLRVMEPERISGLGLEPMLTTSELAEYVGVHVQAIYDLRADGRGPAGIRIGRELRYRISDVRRWLDRLHEPESSLTNHGGER